MDMYVPRYGIHASVQNLTDYPFLRKEKTYIYRNKTSVTLTNFNLLLLREHIHMECQPLHIRSEHE